MGIAKRIIHLAILFIFTTPNMSLTDEPNNTLYFEPKMSNYGFILGIGMKTDIIFCLGVIVSKTGVLSLASCFEQYEKANDHREEEEDEKDKLKVTVRSSIDGDMYNHSVSPQAIMSSRPWIKEINMTNTTTADTQHTDTTTEYEEASERVHYSLYRIDSKRQIFVRLNQSSSFVVMHPYFEKLEKSDLWRHDIAIMSVSADMGFHSGRIRPITIYVSDYGRYIKAQGDEIMNTLQCQVIGLINYDDDGPYTPRDVEVELVAHTVLVDYADCNTTTCYEDEQCRDTGNHIYRDPAYLLPNFIRGSPLVCSEKVLSIVNTQSHCDDSRYSGEFATPQSIRFFLSIGFFETEKANNINFPKSRWIDSSAQSYGKMAMSDWAVGTIVKLILIQIMS